MLLATAQGPEQAIIRN